MHILFTINCEQVSCSKKAIGVNLERKISKALSLKTQINLGKKENSILCVSEYIGEEFISILFHYNHLQVMGCKEIQMDG